MDVNSKDARGQTALCIAANRGSTRIVELLLEREGIDPDIRGPYGMTPLYLAIRGDYTKVAAMLLETGRVDVNMEAGTGAKLTPFSLAACRGMIDVVKLILDTGQTNTDVVDVGKTLLHCWAPAIRHTRMDSVLLNTAEVDKAIAHRYDLPLIFYAADKGYVELVEMLLHHHKVNLDMMDAGKTVFWWAVHGNNPDVLRALLDIGQGDINGPRSSGQTPLMLAVSSGYAGMARLLLNDKRVDVDARDHDGWTALRMAIYWRSLDLVELLLSTGKVDVYSVDILGETPLTSAERSGHIQICQALTAYVAHKQSNAGDGRRVLEPVAAGNH